MKNKILWGFTLNSFEIRRDENTLGVLLAGEARGSILIVFASDAHVAAFCMALREAKPEWREFPHAGGTPLKISREESTWVLKQELREGEMTSVAYVSKSLVISLMDELAGMAKG